MAKLGDICIQITDGSHNPPMGVEQSNYLMLSSKNIDDDHITFNDPRYLSQEDFEAENKRTNIKPNDLLITIVGTIGRVAIVPNSLTEFCVQRSVAVLKPKPEMVYNRFLMYYLQNMRPYLEQESRGVAQKGIYLKQLSNLSIILPPLDEQRKIAAALDKVSDLIAKRRQQLDKLDELIKARFVEMFGGIHNSLDFPYLPIKDFTSVISGGTPDRNSPRYWNSGEIKWVKTTELQNKVINDTEEKITREGLENSSAKMVPANTILIAMYGQGKTRGMTGYLSVEASTNQACACILPSQKINQKYLWQYMILSYEKLRSLAKGGNQPNLNGAMIKNFPVLVPPIELQNQFAAFVEQTEKTKTAISRSLEKLETLKKALMQEYFG